MQGYCETLLHEDGAGIKAAVFCFIGGIGKQAAQTNTKRRDVGNGKRLINTKKYFFFVLRDKGPGGMPAFKR